MDAVQNDLSDVAKLDQHFTDRRAQELALEAETQRAQHVVQMGGVRNERIRKAGIAALLGGAGIGLACFGASFLIAPNTRVVTVTKEIPGPQRVVTVTKEVPGPERVVTKEVPGPERVVIKEVPGPERVVTKEVPGPERVVTVTKEVPGPERVVTKEVPGPERVVIKEVPGPERVVIRPGPIHEHVVTEDVPGPVATPPSPSSVPVKEDCPTGFYCDYHPEGILRHKLAENPTSPPSDAPVTPEEKKFTDKPEYQNAPYRGRIVQSNDGKGLWFEDGKSFLAAHWDPDTSKAVGDPDIAIDSDPYVGDLGMCVEVKDRTNLWNCTAMHNGQEVEIPNKPKTAAGGPQPWHDSQVDPSAKSPGGVAPAMDMVNVDVDVAGYQVEAMVDTGCSFPMAIPTALATALVHDGRAIFAGETKSLLADGKEVDVGVILIKSITVDGRTLDGVEASVSPSNSAPILLGLSALNRLGPFTIDNGRIVFTGDQPA